MATISYPIESGTILNVVASHMKQDTWDHDKWVVPIEWSVLDEMFLGWGKHCRGIIEVSNVEYFPGFRSF